MKCPSCTAPLPPGRARCSYCGSTADIDLAGRTVQECEPPDRPLDCCGCGHAMEHIKISSGEVAFFVSRCPQCLGLFFGGNELDSIIDREVPVTQTIDHLALSRLAEQNGEPVRYRRCPLCRNTMNRVNYGKSSGVVADQCRYHGLFLDAGELRRIVAWVRAGGRLVAAQRAAEQTARVTRELAIPAMPDMDEVEGDLAFPRLGKLILKFLRDRME